ncbi:MAG TPA: pantoate--beta-alanine ligase [Alphaproteobacteria bacterium]|nr:pantoate--beta-alanine ligase [Alphaproteobacteria bacterium]
MQIIKNIADLDSFHRQAKKENLKTAFIPTMGALHDGHLKLVEEGLKHSDRAIVSIFVNPTQFAPHEDFDSYPRTIEADCQKLESVGAHAVWLPTVADIYPNGQETDIHIDGVSEPLEGEFRPHFFDGVATVVARLLRAVKPDVAMFGEKDFQQLQVVKKMVVQEGIPVDIIGVQIVRDHNGLALSSRNAYLSESDYESAIQLNQILVQLAQNMITEKEAVHLLLDSGFDKVDYCVQRNSETFGTENPNRVLAAAWIGKTRLIDNMPMGV